METAVILAEGKYRTPTAKTAHGLVRRSERFKIAGIIDSTCAGQDAGYLLDGKIRDIPIFDSLESVLEHNQPVWLIIGVATVGGFLPKEYRPIISKSINGKINIISGLHEFLNNDPEFSELAKKNGTKILDIRKEPPLEKMHKFSDLASTLQAIRIPVLGTDANIGKRTTGWIFHDALNNAGISTEFVATGQTGLLQGARFGVPLDAIQGDYMVGELEWAIYSAHQHSNPKIIVIEGQGSISHPAYVCGSRAILAASQPQGVILQHAPGRKFRSYDIEKGLKMPNVEKEIKMIELFGNTKVIAITINHEGLNLDETRNKMDEYEAMYNIPVTDPIWFGMDRVVKRAKELWSL